VAYLNPRPISYGMKKVVILRSTGSELSNQLWNYISVYAYTLERKLKLKNYSFFEYGNYFNIPTPSLFFKLFFFLPFTNYTKRKTSFKRRLWRKIYEYCVKIIISLNKNCILVSDNSENKPFYLPPTNDDSKLSQIEKSSNTTYFDGWLFRNPVGIKKYRKEILEYFKPREDIGENVNTEIKSLKNKFKNIVGVHVRQGDYLEWRNGAYFIPQTRVREIIDEYLKISANSVAETCFIITSDGPIDTSLFKSLNVSISKENAVYDLFLLSSTDVILGSNSTFGAFASYYGDIPLIVMQKEEMDWTYYKDRKSYFENKHCTMVHF